LEPDELLVKIQEPWFFIDAENNEPLGIDPIEFQIELGQQYTKE